MRWLLLPAALFLTTAATPAVAQTVYAGCTQRDDPGCRARRERHQLGTYGVPSIDQLARNGVEARRLFVLDAHYADIGLISFASDHGAAPRLSIQPPGYGLRRPAPLSIAVPPALWAEVRAESDAFHQGRRMAVAAAAAGVCVDAWTYIVEAARPALGTGSARIVDQCTAPSHPAWLAERALGLFPACAQLAGHAGSAYDALMVCATLRAEPAAVDTYIVLGPLFERGNGNAVAVRSAFAPDASLVWEDAQPGGATAADRWLREMQSRRAILGFDRIEALSGGRARLTGFVAFSDQQGPSEVQEYRARAVLELTRDGAGRFRIVNARIGRYHRI